MTSYLRYKKELRIVQDADDIESWITVRGNHIPIKKGQSKEEAVKSFLKSKGGNSSAKGSLQKNELSVAYHKDKGHIKEGNPPKGWTKVEGATTAPNGYSWYSNNKSMFGGERESYLYKDKPESAQYRLITKNGKISDILEYNKDLKDWYKANEGGFFKQYLNKDPEFVKKELLRHLTTLKSKEILIEKNEESSKKWSGAWSKRANKPETLGEAAKNATSISKMTKMSASERDEEVGFPMLEIAYNDVDFSADPAKNRSALSKAIKESKHENAELMQSVLSGLSAEELKDADSVRKGIRDYIKSFSKNKTTFYKNVSGKELWSPAWKGSGRKSGYTAVENQLLTEKEMEKHGFNKESSAFKKVELGKKDHHYIFGARFETKKGDK